MTSLSALLRQAVTVPLDFALPSRCPGCGVIVAAPHLFCLGCWSSLDFLGGPACSGCGEPFDFDRGPDALCGRCLADPPAYDGVVAAVSYGPAASRVALRLKYGGQTGLAETMARAMMRLLPEDDDGWLIAPVPLHRWRIWRRGLISPRYWPPAWRGARASAWIGTSFAVAGRRHCCAGSARPREPRRCAVYSSRIGRGRRAAASS